MTLYHISEKNKVTHWDYVWVKGNYSNTYEEISRPKVVACGKCIHVDLEE